MGSVRLLLVIVLPVAACSARDRGIVPEIDRAAIAVDRAAPAALARIDVALLLHGGDASARGRRSRQQRQP